MRQIPQKKPERQWKRTGRIIKHHIVNRCNGGKNTNNNLLQMDEAREKAWHFLFKNKSFMEVAELLARTARMKGLV